MLFDVSGSGLLIQIPCRIGQPAQVLDNEFGFLAKLAHTAG
jgi:hypothetical protein